MGPVDAFKTGIRKAVVFSGRASRSEFWWFTSFVLLVQSAALAADAITHIGYIGDVIYVGLFLPGVAVQVRRMHDINHSGWWIAGFNAVWLISIALHARSAQYFLVESAALDSNGMAGVFGMAMKGYAATLCIFFLMKGTDGPNNCGLDPLAHLSVTPPTPTAP